MMYAAMPAAVGKGAAYGLAMLLGLAMIAYLYPLAFILGTSGSFDQGDSPQHVSGWLLFAADQWRFPLLFTQRLAPPAGLPIFLTDSIPLAALVFKPFARFLPDGFHYFGLWHTGLKLGQALMAVYLVRGLGARDGVSAFAAAALALLWPANLMRTEHTALGTHCLILLALGHYFRAPSWSVDRTAIIFALTAAGALLIHPYLLAMVLAIQVAETGDRMWRERIWLPPLIGLAATWVLLLLLAWVMGYFALGSNLDGGFAIYSMNGLAPICGGDLLPCTVPDATGGQYEGFNYLGLGVLVAIAVALVLSWRRIAGFLHDHPALTCIMVGLVFYALSSEAWVGEWRVLSYKIPYPANLLTETFRASGRFFWPVGFLLIALAVAALARSRRRWVPILLIGVVAVQGADIRSLLHSVQAHASQAPLYNFGQWRKALPGVAAIDVYPAYGCPELYKQPYAFLQLLAGEIGATINTGYLARTNASCEVVLAQSPHALESGWLLVSLADAGPFPQPAILRDAVADGHCQRIVVRDQSLLMCSNDPALDWSALGSAARLATPQD